MRWLLLVLGIICSAAAFKVIFYFDPSSSGLSHLDASLLTTSYASIFLFWFVKVSRSVAESAERSEDGEVVQNS
jgi:hypothetical protein